MFQKNKVTFIIAIKDDTKNLYSTIDSIRKNLNNLDYKIIIKDSNSYNRPSLILKYFYKNQISFFSSKDNSIYEAWNYSLKFVDTEFCVFLGSGDRINYNYRSFLQYAISKKYNFLYCMAKLIKSKKIIGKKTKKKLWPYIVPIVHSGGVFQTKFLIENNFNENYKICSDYELFFRCKNKITINFYNKVCIDFLPNGISQNPKKNLIRIKEMFYIIKHNFNFIKAIIFLLITLISILKKK